MPVTLFEDCVNVSRPRDGIFEAHVLMIIVQRLSILQKRIQIQTSRKTREKLKTFSNDMKTEIRKLKDSIPGTREEAETQDQIQQIKSEMVRHADRINYARHVRIKNFYLDKMGKNNAETFELIRENKYQKKIKR